MDSLIGAFIDRVPFGFVLILWLATVGVCVWLGILLGRFQRDAVALRESCDALRACHLRVEKEVDGQKIAVLQLRQDHEILKVRHGTMVEKVEGIEEAISNRVERLEVVLGGRPRLRD